MSKLSKINKMCKCLECGRKTHSSIDSDVDVQLCRGCKDSAEMEAAHNDGRHDDRPRKKCLCCNLAINHIQGRDYD